MAPKISKMRCNYCNSSSDFSKGKTLQCCDRWMCGGCIAHFGKVKGFIYCSVCQKEQDISDDESSENDETDSSDDDRESVSSGYDVMPPASLNDSASGRRSTIAVAQDKNTEQLVERFMATTERNIEQFQAAIENLEAGKSRVLRDVSKWEQSLVGDIRQRKTTIENDTNQFSQDRIKNLTELKTRAEQKRAELNRANRNKWPKILQQWEKNGESLSSFCAYVVEEVKMEFTYGTRLNTDALAAVQLEGGKEIDEESVGTEDNDGYETSANSQRPGSNSPTDNTYLDANVSEKEAESKPKRLPRNPRSKPPPTPDVVYGNTILRFTADAMLFSVPTCLRLIGEKVCCCLENGTIKVFNLNLKEERIIERGAWQKIYDITHLGDGTCVIATDDGIYMYDIKSTTRGPRLVSGEFTSLAFVKHSDPSLSLPKPDTEKTEEKRAIGSTDEPPLPLRERPERPSKSGADNKPRRPQPELPIKPDKTAAAKKTSDKQQESTGAEKPAEKGPNKTTGVLYAAMIESNRKRNSKVFIFDYNGVKLKGKKELRHPLSLLPETYVTLSVHKKCLYVCSSLNGNIRKISLSKDTQVNEEILGSEGAGSPGVLSKPRLCHFLPGSVLLVADEGNNRLQTVNNWKQWGDLPLSEKVEMPRGAIRYGRYIFVATAADNKISLFKSEMPNEGEAPAVSSRSPSATKL